MQSMPNYLQNGKCSFIFTTLLVHTTNATISTKKPFLYFSQFSPPISPLFVHKTHLTISTNIPFFYTLSIFYLPSFAVNHTKFLHQNIFLPQTFCQFRLRQGTMELGSLVRTETVLMPPFFLEVWTAIIGLTITDSLSLRLRKLVYCRCCKPSNPPSFIPLNYCHYFHTLLIPPQELTFPWKQIS